MILSIKYTHTERNLTFTYSENILLINKYLVSKYRFEKLKTKSNVRSTSFCQLTWKNMHTTMHKTETFGNA